MRGRPLRQWILFLCAWSALAYPIYRITRDTETQRSAPPPAATATTLTWVSLRFSSPPTVFELFEEGVSRWHEIAPVGLTFERALPLTYDAFGAELRITAGLPSDVTAIEIRLEPDGHPPRAHTLWAAGDADATVTFAAGGADGTL